jgi:hypothetical protein
LTEREFLGLHAEIIALQKTLGISYKDASHRLYMIAWENLKADERTSKAFSCLSTRTENIIKGLKTKLESLENAGDDSN